ncbi:EAL domain-containing protein [Shewanella colwelliana]|uniref:EAL domain-containing protein n=1 Tax=Shewanella colwelliana TaxID=23 RepID=UPI0022AF1CF2|nr:EAL domain-containing protein [Shewanella colwelliana]MCZ4338764.1 EAL domain-containing protein [Shewanella colwelliana]
MPNSLLKILLTVLLVLSVSNQTFSHQLEHNTIAYNYNAFSVPEGLSQTTVTSIVEDNQGYLWIGTLNGLNVFDGKEFHHFFSSSDKNSLQSSFIRSLLVLDDGSVLVGTDKGLAKFNRELYNFDRIKATEGFPIWSLTKNDGTISIGTENLILALNPENNVIKKTEHLFRGVKEIKESEDEKYVRNYNGTIFKIRKDGIPHEIANGMKGLIINNGIFFTHDSYGIYRVDNEKLTRISSANIDSMVSTKEGILYLHENKIFKIAHKLTIPKKLGEINLPEKSLINPTLHSINNSLYITTYNTGFYQINPMENIVARSSVTDRNVWSIASTQDENLVIATDSSDIKMYNNKHEIIDTFNSKVEGPKQIHWYKDSLLIAADNGLIKIDGKSKSHKTLIEGRFFAISHPEDDGRMYAGTIDGQIIELDLTGKVINKMTVKKDTPIFGVVVDINTIWIASQNGLYKIDKGTTAISHIYKDELVISLHLSNDKIYFGTETSLLSYNPNEGISKVYVPNKPIYSITSSNNLIFASSIREISITNLNSNQTNSLSEIYGSQEEYNAQSILKINDDILFGGISGISTLSLHELNGYLNNKEGPDIDFKDLRIFNITEKIGGTILDKHINSKEKIELKYSDYPFTISFNSPGFKPKEVEYYYQMSGLSDAWIGTKGIDSATYTNLSPGEYTFSVYAINNLTLSNGIVKSLLIKITPPWWLSTNAKIVYCIISLMIFAVITKAILRRREVQRQIAKSEERLKLSLWGSGDEMWDWDIETGQIYRSNIWGSLEFPRDGQRSGEHGEESNIHPMDQERVTNALNKHFYGETDHFEAAYRVKGKDDQWVWILDRAKIVERDEDDKALRMTGTIKNISNFKQAEEQLRLFERAIENISEGMFILDNQFNFVEVNEACCDLCEKSRNDFIGQLFNFDLYPESYSQQIRNILQQQGCWSNEVESAKGDGTSFLMELTVDAIYDEQGTLSHYVGVFSDISRRKQQEEELRKLTNNDLLTNLPNRSSLMVTLGNLVKKDTHHTLMVLDLDNFKKINDSLGHQVGDELLIKVARRIESTVPYHTSIYRLGGDEFAILVDNNPDIGSSAVIANNVVDAFCSPFELTKDRVVVGVSIGIVLYPEDDQNEQALLRKADIAMYHAKSAGGNRYQFYSESLNRNAIRQLEVENLIREGLRDDLFEVYYQPKIDLKSGKMAGMEALVRLNHPEHGLIPPGDFIPLAEENGLIVEIGEVVLRKACFAAQKWRRQELFEGRVAVNLSSQQFALPDLQQRIESILRLTQLPPGNLELEITEGTVIKQPEKAIKVMMQLSKMGVSLALDDFGTGYSSLSYLKRFPIDTLKIDKAFVDDIDKSDRDLKMVDSIITIAHNMGLSVVGEGVEDASQLSILKALKCEEIQGFIYSKAVNEQAFTELLRQEELLPCSVKKQKKNNL